MPDDDSPGIPGFLRPRSPEEQAAIDAADVAARAERRSRCAECGATTSYEREDVWFFDITYFSEAEYLERNNITLHEVAAVKRGDDVPPWITKAVLGREIRKAAKARFPLCRLQVRAWLEISRDEMVWLEGAGDELWTVARLREVLERTALPLPVGRLSLPPEPPERPNVVLILLRGEEPDGAPNYTYLMMREDSRDAFLATGSNSVLSCVQEYGAIIAADGEGDPPEAIQTGMTEMYGFTDGG